MVPPKKLWNPKHNTQQGCPTVKKDPEVSSTISARRETGETGARGTRVSDHVVVQPRARRSPWRRAAGWCHRRPQAPSDAGQEVKTHLRRGLPFATGRRSLLRLVHQGWVNDDLRFPPNTPSESCVLNIETQVLRVGNRWTMLDASLQRSQLQTTGCVSGVSL